MSFVVKEMPRIDYQQLTGPTQVQTPNGNPNTQQPPQQNGNYVSQLSGNVVGLPGGTPNLLPGHIGGLPQQDDPQRWSQYQHLWRQHVYNNINGNSKPAHGGHGHSAIKDLTSGVLGGTPSQDDKSKDDSELWCNVEAQTAFLGPNLWDKTYETDLKYVDLDEFLSENGVSMDGSGGPLGGLGTSAHSLPKRERSPSPSDCMSPDTLNPPSPADSSTDLTTTNSFSSNSQHSGKPLNFNFFYETLSMASSGRDFDPRTRAFSDEELKPQPMIKKSRKQFVPDNLKDDKYWARRRKNNMAAKRSRDARRMKENQIALRAGYLEKENLGLRQELERLKKENLLLLDKLSKCADA